MIDENHRLEALTAFATCSLSSLCVRILLTAFVTIGIVLSAGEAIAQEPQSTRMSQGSIVGSVRDSRNQPLTGVDVFLRRSQQTNLPRAQPQSTRTDAQGSYRFADVPSGVYKLRAAKAGYPDVESAELSVTANETTAIDLTVLISTSPRQPSPQSTLSAPPLSQVPELYDEPQFTVAGVTQADAGGHGSDVTTRATETLARKTVSLGDKSSPKVLTGTESNEASLRSRLSHDPDDFEANLQLGSLLLERGLAKTAQPFLLNAVRLRPNVAESHHLLGRVNEKSNNSLEAVREYQRAAEIDASEANLFDWGTELLSHLALEPATEVFAKGNHLFPKSDRMLIALGIAWYSRGFYDRASRSLVSACDIDVANPEPYLFLGRLQELQMSALPGASEMLARFAKLRPENALAVYYHAIALSRELGNSQQQNVQPDAANDDKQNAIENLLKQATRLDLNLAPAHLQLGIIFSARGDLQQAVSEYKKVVAISSADADTASEAHYRLAQAYSRMGLKIEANRELELHRQLTKESEAEAARQQRNLQQFVISLKRSAPELKSDH